MIYLSLAGIALCVVGLIVSLFYELRNEIVFDMRIRAIDLIAEKDLPWSLYSNAGTYDAMMFDLRKWKFEHFFPELSLVSANCKPQAT